MQHAEVYDGHKHALTRIDTTFKKHNTNNANNKNVQLANEDIQQLEFNRLLKQKHRGLYFHTLGASCFLLLNLLQRLVQEN